MSCNGDDGMERQVKGNDPAKLRELRRLWCWSKPRHGAILSLCLVNMLVSCGSLMLALAVRGLIDSATGQDGGGLIRWAVLLCGAVLVIRGGGLISALLAARTGEGLLRDLRTMTLHSLLRKEYAGLNGRRSGELVDRVLSDVNTVKNGLMEILPQIAGMAVSFLGAAVILLGMDWRFIPVMVAGGLLGLALIAAFRRPMTARHKAAREAEGTLHAELQEVLENLRLIKASGCEARMEGRTDRGQQRFQAAQLRREYFSAGMTNGIYLVFQLSWLGCMLWGCWEIFRGNLTYGMLAATLQLVGQIQGPLSGAAGIAGQVYGTITSAQRIQELLELPGEADCPPVNVAEYYQNLREIRLRDVEFSYGRGGEPVLKKVSLRVCPGDFTAVMGASGSGKSTLFQLLLGIYRPTGGELRFCFADGEEREADRAMRGLFAYVPQGNTLFSGTLRENLTMFTENATDVEIMEAAEVACIAPFISGLSAGLDTVIGERGMGLSEGQAQRIAVARAILTRAPILLLDECTSALDEETEARMLGNIAALKDRTCLMVTHRKAALEICTSVIRLTDGRVEKRLVNPE